MEPCAFLGDQAGDWLMATRSWGTDEEYLLKQLKTEDRC